MNADLEPIRSNKFTPEQVDKALLVVQLCGGSSEKASKRLREQGITVRASTLRIWRERTYPNRYLAIHARHFAQLEDEIVADQRELMRTAAEGAREAVALERDRIAAGEVKDAAKSAQALETTSGIAGTKILEFTGRPTTVVAHLDAQEPLRRIAARFAGLLVDSTAVELVPEITGQAPADNQQNGPEGEG